MDKPSPQPDISETAGIKVIEHDFELFQKHVMVPEQLEIIKRKSRSLKKCSILQGQKVVINQRDGR